MRCMMRSKLHKAAVTGANVDYEGSITIDPDLLEAADMAVYEQVHVFDITNGNRLVTYIILGERGSGEIILNGAAARLVNKGDRVIIMSFEWIDADVHQHKPTVVILDEENNIIQTK
ncbi:MAG: aspartate 1-decarboxylase [Candidatus Sumerlaeota bacterium]